MAARACIIKANNNRLVKSGIYRARIYPNYNIYAPAETTSKNIYVKITTQNIRAWNISRSHTHTHMMCVYMVKYACVCIASPSSCRLPVYRCSFILSVPQHQYDVIANFMGAHITRKIYCFTYEGFHCIDGYCAV